MKNSRRSLAIVLMVILIISFSAINVNAKVSGGVMPVVVPSATAHLGIGQHLAYPIVLKKSIGTHFGVDIIDYAKDVCIYAMADGVIVGVMDKNGAHFNSLGNAVLIKHFGIGRNGQDVYSLSLHLRDTPVVTVGQEVSKGQFVGYMGKTGAANGVPHIHFEIRYFNGWFSPNAKCGGKANIYHCSDARNLEWALRDWEDPAKFIAGTNLSSTHTFAPISSTPTTAPYLVKITNSSTPERVYLVVNDQLWWIKDERTFRLLGFTTEKCGAVSDWSRVKAITTTKKPRDEPLPSAGGKIAYRVAMVGPSTCLEPTIPTNAIFLMGTDKKFHHITNEEVYYALGYNPDWKDVVPITQDLFDEYGEGDCLDLFPGIVANHPVINSLGETLDSHVEFKVGCLIRDGKGGGTIDSADFLNLLTYEDYVAANTPTTPASFTIPQNLRVTRNNADEIIVEWDPVPGATSYLVYASDGSDRGPVIDPFYRIPKPNPNSVYTFQVKAKGEGVESPLSEVFTVSTTPVTGNPLYRDNRVVLDDCYTFQDLADASEVRAGSFYKGDQDWAHLRVNLSSVQSGLRVEIKTCDPTGKSRIINAFYAGATTISTTGDLPLNGVTVFGQWRWDIVIGGDTVIYSRSFYLGDHSPAVPGVTTTVDENGRVVVTTITTASTTTTATLATVTTTTTLLTLLPVDSTISIPTDFTPTVVSREQVSASWKAVSGADLYQVFMFGQLIGQTTDTSYTFSSLFPYVWYDFQVRAVKGNVGSELSAKSRVITADLPTGKLYDSPYYLDLDDLWLTRVSTDQFSGRYEEKEERWAFFKDQDDGIIIHAAVTPHRPGLMTGFSITDPKGQVIDTRMNVRSFFFNLKDAKTEGRYTCNFTDQYDSVLFSRCFYVFNQSAPFPLSTSTLKIPPQTSAISIPANLQVTNPRDAGESDAIYYIDLKSKAVTLTWTPVPGADKYQIFVFGRLAGETTRADFFLPHLSPYILYSFQVRAVKGNLGSPLSAEVKYQPEEKPAILAPSNFGTSIIDLAFYRASDNTSTAVKGEKTEVFYSTQDRAIIIRLTGYAARYFGGTVTWQFRNPHEEVVKTLTSQLEATPGSTGGFETEVLFDLKDIKDFGLWRVRAIDYFNRDFYIFPGQADSLLTTTTTTSTTTSTSTTSTSTTSTSTTSTSTTKPTTTTTSMSTTKPTTTTTSTSTTSTTTLPTTTSTTTLTGFKTSSAVTSKTAVKKTTTPKTRFSGAGGGR